MQARGALLYTFVCECVLGHVVSETAHITEPLGVTSEVSSAMFGQSLHFDVVIAILILREMSCFFARLAQSETDAAQ